MLLGCTWLKCYYAGTFTHIHVYNTSVVNVIITHIFSINDISQQCECKSRTVIIINDMVMAYQEELFHFVNLIVCPVAIYMMTTLE